MEDYKKQGLLHEMFSRQAKLTPDREAIVEDSGRKITFQDLDKSTDTLAENLRQRGVAVDRCVGIYLQKSIEYSISYIAILKAGGAYLPLDVAYPPHMLKDILNDAKPAAILTSSDLQEKLEGHENVIVMREGWEVDLEKENKSREAVPVSSSLNLDSLAYVVYSSGTTGRPKGVMCPHRGSVFSYHDRHKTYPYTEGDREACNIFFTWEMLRPLLKGIPMYIIANTVIYDPPLLCNFLEKHKITRMLFTPSLFEALLNMVGLDVATKLKSMRHILFCGEVVTTTLIDRCLKSLPWIQFINLYSVSECHDVACTNLSTYFKTHSVNSRKFCPVGKLLDGVKVAILNKNMEPQPVGMSGEIYVGGPTLARGYLNRPEQQALRFIPTPSALSGQGYGDTLYRSGDWGYMLSDGNLEICGRCDSMVKIRGYSIEVQAVEAAIMELKKVHACVVMVKGEEGEDKFLVSYIVPEGGQLSKKEIRAELKFRLPFYMIPSYIVLLSSIPVVAATGKLDKAALPPFDKDSETEVDNEAQPTTTTEKQIATVWKKVLQIQHVDIEESFFDLGGHSLLATELLVSLREMYRTDLAVKDLFDHPTIFSLSQLIDKKLKNTPEDNQSLFKATYDLQKEVDHHDICDVDIDMKLRAFWRLFNLHNQGKFKKARVLLTGATGFLGAFLLRELLRQTKTFVYCLVREGPDKSAGERIKETLEQYGILPNSPNPSEEQLQIQQNYNKRVNAISGSNALVKLGMNEDDYAYLCTDIDFVIHAAASVNLVYPYSALQGANVTGTSNIIQFACTGKIKPIHYISTDAVFPNGLTDCKESDNCQTYHDQLTDGYSQSKWVAEQLVSRAGQRGIPVTIYRLGNMSGDRRFAFWNPQDFTLLMLKACTRFGVAPDIDWYVEMTPVDFAAEFIVKLTHNLSTSLGKTFHVINSKPLHSRLLFEWQNAHGFPVDIIPFQQWRQRVLSGMESLGRDTSMKHLQRLLEGYAKDSKFFTELSTYKTENMDVSLMELGMTYPFTDENLLHTYYTQLSQRKLITPITRPKRITAVYQGLNILI